jgi:hypothetical protein
MQSKIGSQQDANNFRTSEAHFKVSAAGNQAPIQELCLTRLRNALFDGRYGRRLTREEEVRHNIKEGWPEGAIFIADVATVHAAGTTPGGNGARTLLEEVTFPPLPLLPDATGVANGFRSFPIAPSHKVIVAEHMPPEWSRQRTECLVPQLLRELHHAASSAKVSGSVWQVQLAPDHLAQLKQMASPAVALLEKWRAYKRFDTVEPAILHPDLVYQSVNTASSLSSSAMLTMPECGAGAVAFGATFWTGNQSIF